MKYFAAKFSNPTNNYFFKYSWKMITYVPIKTDHKQTLVSP